MLTGSKQHPQENFRALSSTDPIKQDPRECVQCPKENDQGSLFLKGALQKDLANK